MNNKKKMVLGAAFVVAILALAGIGYAASYTGKTTNTTNTVEVEYIYLTLGDNATSDYAENFNADVTFNTVNTAGTIVFTANDIVNIDGHNVVALGSVVVKVTSSVAAKTFDLTMNKSAGTITNEGAYFISTDNTELIAYNLTNGATIEDLATVSNVKEVTITLYWEPGTSYSSSAPPSVNLLNNVTFEFTATAETE